MNTFLFLFIRGKKFYARFPIFPTFCQKKKGFQNTLFGIRRGGKYPPFRTNIYIYNILYKKKGKKETPTSL